MRRSQYSIAAMRPTVEMIRAFYATHIGRRVVREVAAKAAPLLSQHRAERLLAIGYCSPYLAALPLKAERIIQAMPARQGVEAWPQEGANCTTLADELNLPFKEALFDQIIMVHALEFIDPARKLLREAWRLLAPNGRLIIICANRAGLWTHFEATPFGNGRPFGQGQLTQLLHDSLFEPCSWQRALVMPPLRPLMPFERLAETVASRLGGIHIVMAIKTDGAAPVRGLLASARQAMTSPA